MITDQQYEALAARLERVEQALMIAGILTRPVTPPKPTPVVVPVYVRYEKELGRDRAYFVYDCRCGSQHDHYLIVNEGTNVVRCPDRPGEQFDVLIEFSPTYKPTPRTYV